jgi:C4-dicarboxylate-specific signal transduction histidine kinase
LIQDTQVIVKVKDTGTPIDPDILPRLFSKFASKSFEDTRLGLLLKVLWNLMMAYGLKIIILVLIEKEEIHFPLLCQPSIDNKM